MIKDASLDQEVIALDWFGLSVEIILMYKTDHEGLRKRWRALDNLTEKVSEKKA